LGLHEHNVLAVVPIPPPHSSLYFPVQATAMTLVASAGYDIIIKLWRIDEVDPTKPILQLKGHQDVVCALSLTFDGHLLSSSWDMTVRIWKGNECLNVLRGHTQAVWTSLCLPDGDIVTGSGDFTIRRFRRGAEVATYTGHKHTVRTLLLLPPNPLGACFVSASNDSSVRFWGTEGQQLLELYGHEAYIYSISLIPNTTNSFATVGDDHYLRIWNDYSVAEGHDHGCDLWSVLGLKNGDIATGGADGVIRIWSSNPLSANATLISHHDSMLNAIQQKQNLSNLDVTKFPGKEALLVPGTKDQENKIIREGNITVAYKWSAISHEWEKVGEVVGASPQNQPHLLSGRQYDYIFSIDVEDGGPLRKLGYNNGENPYEVAQDFLIKEDLPPYFLEKVASFIIENSTPVIQERRDLIGDPYTGQNRYIPTSSNQTTPGSDPFTGANRYIPGSSVNPTNINPTPTPTQLLQSTTQSTLVSPYKTFPQKQFLYFETLSLSNLQKKLTEFNAQLEQENAQCHLTQKELSAISRIIQILSETSRYHGSSFYPQDSVLLVKLLNSWPPNFRFPVLDLIRMYVLHPSGSEGMKEGLIELLLKELVCVEAPIINNVIFSLRIIANLFRHPSTRILLPNYAERILETMTDIAAKCNNKNVSLSLVTVLLNFSVLYLDKPKAEVKIQLASVLEEILRSEKDEETLFRGFVTLGTLVWEDSVCQSVVQDLGLLEAIKIHTSSPSKLQQCSTELVSFLETNKS